MKEFSHKLISLAGMLLANYMAVQLTVSFVGNDPLHVAAIYVYAKLT